MNIAVDPGAGWTTRDDVLVHGVLVVRSVADSFVVPDGFVSTRTPTRTGWPVTLYEGSSGSTAFFIAKLEIDGDIAALVGQCPVDDRAVARVTLIELLATARPEWPGTILISELLALPDIER